MCPIHSKTHEVLDSLYTKSNREANISFHALPWLYLSFSFSASFICCLGVFALALWCNLDLIGKRVAETGARLGCSP